MMQRKKGARWPELPSYALGFIEQRERKASHFLMWPFNKL